MEEGPSKTTVMRALTPKNFHLWIKELQGIAEKNKVWAYVDPEGTKPEPDEGEYPDISRFQVPIAVITDADVAYPNLAGQQQATQPAMYADQLNDRQRASYQLDIQTFKLRQQHAEKVASGIRIVDNAIKSSARMYISDDMMTATVRETIQALAKRYKQTRNQIIEQLHIQFLSLKTAPAKDKIESWVADWENMSLMINNEATGLFGSETIFIDEFLRAGRKWAPNFCDNWMQQKEAANLIPEFFDTARHYRLAVEKAFNQERLSARSSANAATLQGQPQSDQKPKPGGEKGSGGKGKSSAAKREEWERKKFKNRKCLCGEVHLFRDCPYINKSNRSTGWKESKTMRTEIREKIKKSYGLFKTIKRVANSGILDGISEKEVQENDPKPDKQKEEVKSVMYSYGITTKAKSMCVCHGQLSLIRSTIAE